MSDGRRYIPANERSTNTLNWLSGSFVKHAVLEHAAYMDDIAQRLFDACWEPARGERHWRTDVECEDDCVLCEWSEIS